MSAYGFSEDSARRISRVVKAVEGGTSEPTRIGPMLEGATMSVVRVTSLGSPLCTGQRVDYHASTNTMNDINEIRIREINGGALAVGQRYMGQFSGYDSTGKPVFIVDLTAPTPGTGTITVVTGVGCSVENGLEVTYATFSGADYDNAVTRQFLSLQDVTPISFAGNQGRVVKVNDSGTALEFGVLASGSPTYTTFIALSDTPANFAASKGDANKTLMVNADGVSIGFVSARVTVTNSITGGGNPNTSFAGGGTDLGPLRLVNDTASPGNNKFYGTTSTGVRGWRTYTLSIASDFPSSYTGAAGKFLKVNAAGNAVEFSAVDIAAMQSAIADLTARVTALEAP